MLERALVIMAQALAYDLPDFAQIDAENDQHRKRAMMQEWDEAYVLRQEELIADAKKQAMLSMRAVGDGH